MVSAVPAREREIEQKSLHFLDERQVVASLLSFYLSYTKIFHPVKQISKFIHFNLSFVRSYRYKVLEMDPKGKSLPSQDCVSLQERYNQTTC